MNKLTDKEFSNSLTKSLVPFFGVDILQTDTEYDAITIQALNKQRIEQIQNTDYETVTSVTSNKQRNGSALESKTIGHPREHESTIACDYKITHTKILNVFRKLLDYDQLKFIGLTISWNK